MDKQSFLLGVKKQNEECLSWKQIVGLGSSDWSMNVLKSLWDMYEKDPSAWDIHVSSRSTLDQALKAYESRREVHLILKQLKQSNGLDCKGEHDKPKLPDRTGVVNPIQFSFTTGTYETGFAVYARGPDTKTGWRMRIYDKIKNMINITRSKRNQD